MFKFFRNKNKNLLTAYFVARLILCRLVTLFSQERFHVVPMVLQERFGRNKSEVLAVMIERGDIPLFFVL